jgi:beta-glucosidase
MKKLFILIFALLTVNGIKAQSSKEEQMTKLAHEIISKMTLDEKISQLMNETPGIPRLGILPYDWWSEGLHGVGRDGRATVFPQPICLGSTFDPALVQRIGDAVSSEGRAKFNVAQKLKNYSRNAGITYWSPNVNIFRDPRWGRGMETYGEDPFLSGSLGTAYVKGMQGDDPFYLKVGACGKHFAVHSGPEATRHTADINPTKRDLFETYLPAFRMLVQKGHVETIMGAYNSVYGQSCSGSKYLLTDILRKQWGFKGHIVSDCGAVSDIYYGHRIAKSEAEACAIAIKAGLNLECGNTFKAMRQAIDEKLLTEADIDKALMPLMMTRLKLGIVNADPQCPYNNIPESEICSDAHTAIAKQASTEGMVLLKNDGILPLDKNVRTLFVAGPGASDAFYLMGNYFGLSNRYCTYLQGIVAKVSDGTSVNYRPGFMQITPELNDMNWAVREASESEVAIVVMGNNGNIEGEEGEAFASATRGDRVSISLPESQMSYLRRVKKIKKDKIVVVLTGGSPIDVKEITQLADAVVMAWYPGQEGGYALADLLFGDANFSGRLPITFPESVDKLPAFDDYTMNGRTYKYMTDNIMYPFGYGLSYGHITYSDAKIIGKAEKDKPLKVSATLHNDGKMNIDEVAQVYLTAPTGGKTSPLQSLIAFKRVTVPAGSDAQVDFDIPAEQLQTVQQDGTSKIEKGAYVITISGAAPGKRTQELGVSSSAVNFKL